MPDEETVEFYHEHELPRKRRKAYDDINTPHFEGGETENEL